MRRALLVALPLALLLGLALSQVDRDVTPPGLFIEAIDRVPAGAPLDVAISASEPVTFEVEYGPLAIQRVDDALRLNLLAAAGRVALVVTATDAAGNATRQEIVVHGVPAPVADLRVRDRTAPGAPLGVELDWRSDAPLEAVTIRFGDAALEPVAVPLPASEPDPHRPLAGRIWALAAVPLDAGPGVRTLHVELIDDIGNRVAAEAPIAVEASTSPIETLALEPGTLALVTPAARQLETETLAEARAEAMRAPQWDGAFVAPIEGRGTSGFGAARRYAPGGPVSYHQGEDIAAPTGTPVVATNEGVVRIADAYPIKGGWVAIDHGAGVFSHYFHLASVDVAVGDRVARGEPIGTVGSTGLSTGPHLHWEMRIGAAPTDPTAWVGRVLP